MNLETGEIISSEALDKILANKNIPDEAEKYVPLSDELYGKLSSMNRKGRRAYYATHKMEETTMREMTYGEKAVGLTFNPSGDEKVQKVKELYAQIIDLCNEARTEAGQGEKGRLLSVAITEAQTAQMWAVKGITYKF